MAVDGAFGQAFLGRIEEGALVVRVDLVVGAPFAHADEEAGLVAGPDRPFVPGM